MAQRFAIVLAGLAFVAGAVVLYLDGRRPAPVPAARPVPTVAAPASAPSAPPTAPAPVDAEAAPRPAEPATDASPAAAPSPPPEPAAAAEPARTTPVVVHRPAEPAEVAETAEPAEPAETAEPAARTSAPSFDVVSVNPAGHAVIAGRAAPGSRVVLRDDETPIGETVADAGGTFVIVPEQPLAPGARTLDLEARAADAAPGRSEDMVVVMVPETAGTAAPAESADAGASPPEPPQPVAVAVAVAVALPREGPGAGRVLQPAGPDGTLAIDTIDYDQAGYVTIAGRAPPGARILVYLGEALAARTSPGGSGRWTAALEADVPPGLYALRVDQVADDGHVVARVEVPFDRRVIAAEPGGRRAIAPEPSGRAVVVVRRGNTLWHIARRTYGRGIDYTIIYAANADQIRNPDLIYPGQVFTLPPAPEG